MRLLSRTTTSLAIAALAASALAPAASAADEQPVTGSPETGTPATVGQLETSLATTAEAASAVAGSPATSSEETQPAAAQPAADQGVERAAATPSSTTITILGITDFHGHLLKDTESLKDGTTKELTGGATGLACAVKTAREANENTLFVSAGDNVGGWPTSPPSSRTSRPLTRSTPSAWTSPPPGTTNSTAASRTWPAASCQR